MPHDREKEEKKEGFKVSDRRLFTSEGELRPEAEAVEEHGGPAILPNTAPPQQPPTAEEQRQTSSAYQSAHERLDSTLETALGNQHRPESLEATFDSFIASLYMTSMLQLGLLHERDEQPQVDLVGARHTIDTLAMLEEKTRGNLTQAEKSLLQDCLFRLRMGFVEITNALTNPPTNPPGKK